MLNLEPEYVESEARSDIKSALYALVEFIDRLDVNGRNSEAKDAVLEIEQVKDLNKLLKTLAEIEQFYDCVGGIIGLVKFPLTPSKLQLFYLFKHSFQLPCECNVNDMLQISGGGAGASCSIKI